jgi:hypothetical protein
MAKDFILTLNSSKHEFNVLNVLKFSFYITENTLPQHHKALGEEIAV